MTFPKSIEDCLAQKSLYISKSALQAHPQSNCFLRQPSSSKAGSEHSKSLPPLYISAMNLQPLVDDLVSRLPAMYSATLNMSKQDTSQIRILNHFHATIGQKYHYTYRRKSSYVPCLFVGCLESRIFRQAYIYVSLLSGSLSAWSDHLQIRETLRVDEVLTEGKQFCIRRHVTERSWIRQSTGFEPTNSRGPELLLEITTPLELNSQLTNSLPSVFQFLGIRCNIWPSYRPYLKS